MKELHLYEVAREDCDWHRAPDGRKLLCWHGRPAVTYPGRGARLFVAMDDSLLHELEAMCRFQIVPECLR